MLEMPAYERPRERLKRLGADALRSDELLAILLGSGSKKEPVLELSKSLIRKFGSLEGIGSASIEELQSISGIGFVKALKIKAAFELSCRKESLIKKEAIKTPEQAFEAIRPYIRNEKREVFFTLLLDVKCQLIDIEIISIGILTTTLIHPREVFFPAIRKKAHALVVIHNHPSGDTTPSDEDFSVTNSLYQASLLIGIPIFDHLIVTKDGYFSFKMNGFEFTFKT